MTLSQPIRAIGAAAIFASIAVSAHAQNVAGGATLFQQRCAMCHSATAGKASPAAPNLYAIKGRKAGSTAFAYSPALKQSNVVWTQATLDTFLAAPGKMVPGTRMPISVPAASQRADIVAYLLSLGK